MDHATIRTPIVSSIGLSIFLLVGCGELPTDMNSLQTLFSTAQSNVGYDLGLSAEDCIDYPMVGSDVDGDFTSDECEWELAKAFSPRLAFHEDEPYVSREPRFAAQCATHLEDACVPNEIRILYMLGYHKDWGAIVLGFFRYGPHHGDSEFIDIRVTYDETDGRWKLTSMFTSAHYKTPNDQSRLTRYDDDNMRFEDNYRGRPKVYVSKDKHANYPTGRLCDDGFYESCLPNNRWFSNINWVNGKKNVGRNSGRLVNCVESETVYEGEECYFSSRYFTGWQEAWGPKPPSYHYVMMSRMYTARPLPPKPDIWIRGPQRVRPGASCTWQVMISNEDAVERPISIEWYVNDENEPASTGSLHTDRVDSESFRMQIYVSDATGQRTMLMLQLSVREDAPHCEA